MTELESWNMLRIVVEKHVTEKQFSLWKYEAGTHQLTTAWSLEHPALVRLSAFVLNRRLNPFGPSQVWIRRRAETRQDRP